jgi:hypothetical protein
MKTQTVFMATAQAKTCVMQKQKAYHALNHSNAILATLAYHLFALLKSPSDIVANGQKTV